MEKKNTTLSAVNNKQLATLAERALPCLSGDSVSYNADKNIFLTSGYTSTAGNTYYKTYRLSDRLCISCSLGQGYAYLFLNGLSIYGWDGHQSRLLGNWTSPCTTFFSDSKVKDIALSLVKDYLASQAKLSGSSIPDSQLLEFSKGLIEETEKKRIA
ncbi:MAG: hypothetical protein MJY94_00675 [Bacteroidales bacterium]|nr:hypothetical protein [Bacteroidales bacterium]